MDKINSIWRVGDWHFDPQSGVLTSIQGDQAQRLEPKTSALLTYLLEHAGHLVSKDELVQTLWPDSYASDETIARTLSRLRAVLIDDPRQPNYIETIPKRGYRLIASVQGPQQAAPTDNQTTRPTRYWLPVSLLLSLSALMWWFFLPPQSNPTATEQVDLLQQADDYYHQMRLADNERAISLYQQQLELQPSSAGAYAGLANATVQKLLRWSGTPTPTDVSLVAAVQSGQFDTPEAQQQLQRALSLAEKAVAIQPQSASAQKALGFVLTARGELERALAVYQRALKIDSNAWPAWLNMAEIYAALEQDDTALQALENAYTAMQASYDEQTLSIHPWLAEVAANIGERYNLKQDYGAAETWFRRVLRDAPLHERATVGLAYVLAQTGDYSGALKLCDELNQRLQLTYNCNQFVAPDNK